MRSEGVETLKAVARRSVWIVLALVALGVLAMNLVRKHEGPLYSATSRVILSPLDIAAAAAGINTYVDPQLVDQTETALAQSPQLFDQAARDAGGLLGTGSELRSSASVSKNGGTIYFDVSGSNPKLTVARANAIADTYQSWRAGISTATVQKAIDQVNSQLAGAKTRDPNLVDQLNRLKVLKVIASGGNVLLVEHKGYAIQTRPRPIRDSVLGGFIGLFFALLVVAGRELIDTRVRSEAEVEELLNVPVLGTVETLPRRTTLVSVGRHRERFADMYALVAANLIQTSRESKATVIAVTSATAEEGKTTTASNLAAALATRNENVVLVDLDSRKPSLGRIFRIPNDAPGLSEVLRKKTRPEDAMWSVSLNGRLIVSPVEQAPSSQQQAAGGNGRVKSGSLRVLPMGPENGKITLAGRAERLKPVIESIQKHADFVVIDTPPVLSLPDMTEISDLVDVVLIVVRHGRVSRRSLASLMRIQRNWTKPQTSAVLVGTPRHEDAYSYYRRA
jgi:Mrp family chromosome partitioning ATPase